MKVYLSGPMSGLPQYNAPAFEAAAKELRRHGIEVVSPIELDRAEGHSLEKTDLSSHYWEFLARDIQTIGEGHFDAIYVLPGWGGSVGARLEVFQGLLMHIPIMEYTTGKLIHRARVMNNITQTTIFGG